MSNIPTFARNAYGASPYLGESLNKDEYVDLSTNKETFTGSDLQAYIGNNRVSNMESLTCSISVEIVPVFAMGRRDALSHTVGKRVIVGSVVFAQFDRHAFIEEVWKFSKRGISSRKDLWQQDPDNAGAILANSITNTSNNLGNVSVARANYNVTSIGLGGGTAELAAARGITQQQWDAQLAEQAITTARVFGAEKIRYSDQIPAFDTTLIGCNSNGAVSRAAIYGMRMSQETFGWSSTDLANQVGMSYVALAVDPWINVEVLDSNLTIPGFR